MHELNAEVLLTKSGFLTRNLEGCISLKCTPNHWKALPPPRKCSSTFTRKIYLFFITPILLPHFPAALHSGTPSLRPLMLIGLRPNMTKNNQERSRKIKNDLTRSKTSKSKKRPKVIEESSNENRSHKTTKSDLIIRPANEKVLTSLGSFSLTSQNQNERTHLLTSYHLQSSRTLSMILVSKY